MSFKLVIRTLSLILCLVILYIVAVILYSVKYWPDLYDYINANITIKHIPTITELNETNGDLDFSYNPTLDDQVKEDIESTTDNLYLMDIFFEDFTTSSDDLVFADFLNARNMKIKSIDEKDYSSVPVKPVIVDYFFDYKDEYPRDMNDLLDTKKLTTRSSNDVEVFYEGHMMKRFMQNNLKYNPPPLTPVYPWIVAIYIKSDNSDQFEYYCDGALLSDRCILTAARCVWRGNQTVETKHVIAILGKQNLKAMRFEERIIRIHQITVHPNFTTRGEESTNDLAMMHMEHAVIFSDRISAARMETDEDNGDIDKAATTGWAYNGELTPIYFDQQISDYCKTKTSRTRFCATYAPEVTVCPSRGGLFVIKLSSRWYLHGISTGGRSQTAACFGNDAEYTSLTTYMTWILDTLNLKYI